jgi:hypothetical protein
MMVRRGPAVAQAEAFPLRDILFSLKQQRPPPPIWRSKKIRFGKVTQATLGVWRWPAWHAGCQKVSERRVSPSVPIPSSHRIAAHSYANFGIEGH